MQDASWASSEGTRRSMRANRGRDTKPELAVRRAVHRRGLRYRVDTRPLPGLRRRADLVFRRAKVAVFVDGCYWHGCPIHATQPQTNKEFWDTKLRRNRERDLETNQALEAAGWTVLRFWEHESPELVAETVASVVRTRKSGSG